MAWSPVSVAVQLSIAASPDRWWAGARLALNCINQSLMGRRASGSSLTGGAARPDSGTSVHRGRARGIPARIRRRGFMLKIQICNTAGEVLANGTCSESGFFPTALAGIYNTALDLMPRRSLQTYGSPADSADYPVGTSRTRFGYVPMSPAGGDRVLDDEVIVHVERT